MIQQGPPPEELNVVKTVYVMGSVNDDALNALQSRCEVVRGYLPGAPSLADVAELVDAILVRTQSLDATVLRKARNCRIISRRGVGVDNIDVATATALGIPVTITAAANARTVAEHVFALALALLHNVVEGDRSVRGGDFAARDRHIGRDLYTQRLGVIGVGRIGREVIRIARRGFDMPVMAYDQPNSTVAVSDDGVEVVADLNLLLERSDIVTVHTPLTSQTRGLLGHSELRRMKPGSRLIHTARGGIVDEQALLAALRDGHLAGAGVDVYTCEPPPADHPLLAIDNVLATPHSAGLTAEAVDRMSRASVGAILDVLDGATADDLASRTDWEVVNPQYAQHQRVVSQ